MNAVRSILFSTWKQSWRDDA